MGNQPSTTTHNKLSKPRTNTNSHSFDSPNPAFSKPADLSAEGRQQIRDALLSPTADEFGSDIWPQRNDNAIEVHKTRERTFSITSRSNSRTHSRSNSRSNSLSCFGSKQGSTAKLAGMADARSSLVSPSHVDIAEAIKLLQQLKKNASPEDLAALHEVLEAPEEYSVPVAEPSTSRRTSMMDRSSASLTRRKSLLQTPGVGTRNSPVEGRRRTWNSWKAPNLEPEEEAKWQPTPQTTLSPVDRTRDNSGPRAPTPSELDYSHLGNLQLGSLVVTNGAASPASSIRTARPRNAEAEDYFLQAELGSSPLMMKSTRRRGHPKSKSASLPVTSPLSTVDNNETPVPSVASAPTPSTSKSIPFPSYAQPTLPDHWDDGWQDAKSNADSAAKFAESYQADLPVSPFPVLDKSLAVSKDEGLVSDDADSPKAPVARSFHRPTYDRLVPPVEIKVSAPAVVSSAPKLEKPRSRVSRRPQPQTTDSGYSSGSSLRVAEQEQRTNPGPMLCHGCDGSQQDSDASHENQPCQANLSKQSMEVSPRLGTAQLLQLDRQRPSLKVSTDSASSSARSSTSEVLLSPTKPKPVSSRASWSGPTEKPRQRFHRRKSLAEQLVVQSCQSIPEGMIPEVPTKVRTNFERRVSSTPGMDCLTQTYPTKNHVVAEDTRPAAPLPSWSEFKLLAELEPEPPLRPPMQGRRKSLSFFRRKSMSEESQPQSESVPVDGAFMGLIAASIGGSPYDPAISGLPKQTIESPTHPYQLGTSVHRSKSMVNIYMDSKAAAEFARAHSKDLAVAKQVLPRQRPRSLHNLKIEAGEARASKRRPQSVDIPPVPSIDTSKLLIPATAKPRGPRPEKQSPRSSRSSLSPAGRAPQHSQTASPCVSKDESCPPQPPQHGVNWEAQSKAWAQRRKSIGESLRPANAPVKTNHPSADLQAQTKALSHRRKSVGASLRPANDVIREKQSSAGLEPQSKALSQRRKSVGESLRPANAVVRNNQSSVDLPLRPADAVRNSQSFVDVQAQSRAMGQRRKSVGESLRSANAVRSSQSFVDVQAQSMAMGQRRKSVGGSLRPASAFIRNNQSSVDLPLRPANAVIRNNKSSVDLPLQTKALSQRRKSMGESLRPASAVRSSLSFVDMQAQSRAMGQRRKSMGGSLRPAVKTSQSAVDVRIKGQVPEVPESWGRFSGGLEYNWEGRGTGIGGSAGTRQLNSKASVKSLHFQHQYGVDLSDVPIMLQRV